MPASCFRRCQPPAAFPARRLALMCALLPSLCSYLSWDDYFMAVAFLSAQRSKDPNKQAGSSGVLVWLAAAVGRCCCQGRNRPSVVPTACAAQQPARLANSNSTGCAPMQVGACIVDANNVICGIGYNGFPRGCADSQV